MARERQLRHGRGAAAGRAEVRGVPARALAAAALAALLARLGGVVAPSSFVPGPRQRSSPVNAALARAHADTLALSAEGIADTLPSEGWYNMPLGVPKVAYRIPGAPNAEWVDIYNRMYRERIIFLGKEIDDKLANEIIGVLLYLDSEDNNKPIYLYINSAGGSVLAGLAIYDTMNHIKSPVVTINVGMAASMASFLLASGEKGKRIALPHSRVMLHQAMGGAQGQAEDIKVEAEQILQINSNIVRMYAATTGQDETKIREDLQRDNFMDAETAKSYGIIDQVIKLQDVDLEKRDDTDAETAGEAPKGADEPSPEVAEEKPKSATSDDDIDTKAVN